MVNDFVKELREKEIAVSFSKGKLHYSGPEKYIDAEVLQKLSEYKSKLLKYYWPPECPNMMPINTEGTKIPFTILHAGEANYTLSEYFGPDQPFYGFFYIGSEGEKISYKNVESFAREYLNQLVNIIPNGPYLLGGLSFGGILAYEIAIQLQKEGQEVPFIALVDCAIPFYNKRNNEGKGSLKYLRIVYHLLDDTFHWCYDNGREIVYKVLTEMKIGLPKNFRKPYILWTYGTLMKRYKPTEKFKGEVLLFRTEANNIPDPYLGWTSLCDHIEVIKIEGDHNSMYRIDGSINVLKEKIQGMLTKLNNR